MCTLQTPPHHDACYVQKTTTESGYTVCGQALPLFIYFYFLKTLILYKVRY